MYKVIHTHTQVFTSTLSLHLQSILTKNRPHHSGWHIECPHAMPWSQESVLSDKYCLLVVSSGWIHFVFEQRGGELLQQNTYY